MYDTLVSSLTILINMRHSLLSQPLLERGNKEVVAMVT